MTFAWKQMTDKQDGGIILQRNLVKCNCHRLKYLVLYYKSVIALILYLTFYHPSLPLYLPADSISKTRIKVRVS